MREPNFGWEYPPGVTGREPELTGEWPCQECGGRGGFPEMDEDGHTSYDRCTDCGGKGYTNGDEDGA